MEFKDKIVILRKAKNISQEKFADILGISRQAVSKWESGESLPEIDKLVIISDFFNVSIDRLLREDNCMNILEENLEFKDNNDIIDFLIMAKKNMYANNNSIEIESSRPKSHDFKFENGEYKYIDTYLGGERFIGEEAVFKNDKPLWAMNYNGVEYNEKFSGSFLKKCLSTVNRNEPYRGQAKFQEGDYVYVCESFGDFEYFYGKEIIYYKNEKVYECNFSGGIIV